MWSALLNNTFIPSCLPAFLSEMPRDSEQNVPCIMTLIVNQSIKNTPYLIATRELLTSVGNLNKYILMFCWIKNILCTKMAQAKFVNNETIKKYTSFVNTAPRVTKFWILNIK